MRDLDRANEWCLRVRDIATRFEDRQMFAVCRTHSADVLLWHGDWERANEELTAAVAELEAIRPGREADPLVRLAELRRRQGRVRESEELLARAASHPLHPLVQGLLALDRGDAEAAHDAAARFLRRIGPADRFERVAGLELMVRSGVAAGDADTARHAGEEIAAIAATTPSAPLRAAALLAEGRIAAAQGEAASAVAPIEDAADLLEGAGARYEAALARLGLAAALRMAGADEPARRTESRARQALTELGARAGERLRALLGSPRSTVSDDQKGRAMPKASNATASEMIAMEGFEGHYAKLAGGYTVGFEFYSGDSDPAELFKGLPDGRCQSPH